MLLGGPEKGSEAAARLVALDSTTEQVGEDILVRARFKEW